MKLYGGPFSEIKNKTMDIELRLYDEKREINVGECIKFTNIKFYGKTDDEFIIDCEEAVKESE